jgi:diguanylate cyclase (GGDEF)-like protein
VHFGAIVPDAKGKRRLLRAGATICVLAIVVVVTAQSFSERATSLREVETRFEDRIHLAGQFVEAHVADMRERQLDYARSALSDTVVTPDQFDAANLSFGFEAAMLLDADGHALAVAPQAPGILGTDVASKYAHLASAVGGTEAVSVVVESAVAKERIVAVAVPFDTESGRRVISGGYDLSTSPLTTFLESTSSLAGRQVYLVDQNDEIIATTDTTETTSLAVAAPELIDVPAATTAAFRGQSHYVVSTPIAETPWRLVAAVPADALHEPADNSSTWALVAVSVVMAVAVLALLRHTSRQRDHLDDVSRTDSLTSLPNRKEGEIALARAAASSSRTQRPWAVTMLDVDHFKSVNDRLGHAAGDQVLKHVAAVLQGSSRAADSLARWGGEEFILVMQDTDVAQALMASERLVAAVRQSMTEDGIQVTMSAGTASGVTTDADALVGDADRALYAAKAAGRDQAVAATPHDLSRLEDTADTRPLGE